MKLLQLGEHIAPHGLDDAQASEIEQISGEEFTQTTDQHDDGQERDGEGHLVALRQIKRRLATQPLRPRQERGGSRRSIAEDRWQDLAHEKRQTEGVGGCEDDGREQRQEEERTASLQVGQVELVATSEHATSVAASPAGGNIKSVLFLLRKGDREGDREGQDETDD